MMDTHASAQFGLASFDEKLAFLLSFPLPLKVISLHLISLYFSLYEELVGGW